MAEQSSKSLFTREEALALLDEEEDGIDDNFFPSSNEDLVLNKSVMQGEMTKTVLQRKMKKNMMQGKT